MLRNRLILFGWAILALFRVPGSRILKNRRANEELLRTGSFWKPGEYIENQLQWDGVRFGTRYSMSYGGCGIFAVYNALVALGEQMTAERMEELLESFQRKGAALGGKFGLRPVSIRRFLESRGFRVTSAGAGDEASVNALESAGKVFVVTAFNSRRLRDQLHTVCITRDGREGYTVHNCFRYREAPDGSRIYCANGPFPTLWEAVFHISVKGAVPLMVLAIEKLAIC